jgi:heat shock protein HslJ
VASNDYVRTGNTIVLLPKADYYQKYPQEKNNFFINHLHPPYLYLAGQLGVSAANNFPLEGAWELQTIVNNNAGELYKEKKPLLRFDGADKFSGNTGCNSFSGSVEVSGAKLSFSKTMAMTGMMCPGTGEQIFLQSLEKVDAYTIQDGKLILLSSGTIAMQFSKK